MYWLKCVSCCRRGRNKQGEGGTSKEREERARREREKEEGREKGVCMSLSPESSAICVLNTVMCWKDMTVDFCGSGCKYCT